MESKWFKLKPRAVRLRKQGVSIRTIEQRLGIPRSTLSGWFRTVTLTSAQQLRLRRRWQQALVHARQGAVLWHNAEKRKRVEEARQQASETLRSIDMSDKRILELALSILYMGEGSKKNEETALGSTDPRILKFFLAAMHTLYRVDVQRIRCELYLRVDQDTEQMKRHWAHELRLPLSAFRQVNKDRRTIGSKTYAHYKGVCHVRCGQVAIQRKLVFLATAFMREVSLMNIE